MRRCCLGRVSTNGASTGVRPIWLYRTSRVTERRACLHFCPHPALWSLDSGLHGSVLRLLISCGPFSYCQPVMEEVPIFVQKLSFIFLMMTRMDPLILIILRARTMTGRARQQGKPAPCAILFCPCLGVLTQTLVPIRVCHHMYVLPFRFCDGP